MPQTTQLAPFNALGVSRAAHGFTVKIKDMFDQRYAAACTEARQALGNSASDEAILREVYKRGISEHDHLAHTGYIRATQLYHWSKYTTAKTVMLSPEDMNVLVLDYL